MTTDPLEEDLDGMLQDILEKQTAQTAASDEAERSSQLGTSYLSQIGPFTRGGEISGAARTELARKYMDELAAKLELNTQTVGMGEQIFEQFADKTDLTGRVVEFVAAASLYCACKINEVPINPETFAEAVDEPVTLKYLLRRSKGVATTVGLDPGAFFDATHYVPGYCTELGVSDDVEERAIEIIKMCQNTQVESGKSPTGLAAAAIYNASLEFGEGVRQSEIASVADVTEVTIRNRYKDQRDYLQENEIPPEDTVACVWWLHDRIEAPDGVFFAAADLLAVIYGDSGVPDEETEAIDWALGALRVVGKYEVENLGLRTLSQFASEGSSPVKYCSRYLSRRKHKRNSVYRELRKDGTRLYDIADRGLTLDEFESIRDQVRSALATQLRDADSKKKLTEELPTGAGLSDEEIHNGFPTVKVARASLAYRQEFGNPKE